MRKILEVTVLDGYRLELVFEDGERGVVDLGSYAGKGVFEAWNDVNEFRAVKIGSYGELSWGETIDLCPDALYLEVTGKRPEDIFPALNREGAHA